MQEWRVIIDKAHTAANNMARDEAMLERHIIPTLRLYSWSPAAVSIGYFQSLTLEVDVEECRRQKVDVVRRITGGGAVFHEHELTYSIVVPESMVPKDIIRSYETICGAVVKGLRSLSIDARFSPINDIVVYGKKVSGSAQTRRNGFVLQHGTIILDVDVEQMFSLLQVPDEKMKGKAITDARERVMSLGKLKPALDVGTLHKALIASFADTFFVRFVAGELHPEELQLVAVLTEKFKSDKWTTMR
jgi:lipoate---protein ligase